MQNMWFWFSIIICPFLILAAIYNLGFLAGYIAYLDFSHLSSEQLTRLILVVAGGCAIPIFYRGVKQAKVRFKST